MWDLSSLTRGRTCILSTGKQILNHWTTREVPRNLSVLFYFGYFFFLHFLTFIFNQRIVALQCSVGFCCTTTWISRKCTRIRSLLNLPPTPPAHPSTLAQSTRLSSLFHQQLATSCFTYGNVDVSVLLSQLAPPSPSPTASVRLFSTSASLSLPCR